MSRNTYTNKIDDDSVKGLYTTKPFKDGYTGYYNYFPSEGVYMSGKKPTNESKPLSKRLKKELLKREVVTNGLSKCRHTKILY